MEKGEGTNNRQFESLDLSVFKDANLSKKLQCLICHSVPTPENAYIHRQCGKLFCKAHIEEWFRANPDKTCPYDRTKNAEIVLCRGNDQFAYSTLIELELVCPISSQCRWIGQLGDLSTHILGCDYVPRPCRYFQIGCSFKGTKSELELHYTNTKDTHIELLEKALFQETQKNAHLVKTLEGQTKAWRNKVESLTEELTSTKHQLEALKRQHVEVASPKTVVEADSFRWDTSLQNGVIFQFFNDAKTVQKVTDTTYSVITKAALPDKVSWRISLDRIHYYSEPAAGFGICMRKQIGSCKGSGGYLSCAGGIGVTIRGGLHGMKGKVNLLGGETYLCELNTEAKTFMITGKNTHATANIEPGKYYIYAEFYKAGEQISILLQEWQLFINPVQRVFELLQIRKV
eukprot:TRINITY_DN2946_c0_g1_i1.p1 TRINITY_DN2946_c0_g1~~TRINITY_DN2946_c0_g1_i1.p1  ORF type:complete len:439 (+),score=35.53 TRINITY_DN2946_c0_g1_i1:113-1318(+)